MAQCLNNKHLILFVGTYFVLFPRVYTFNNTYERKEEGKDRESIKSNTTPDQEHHMGK